MTRMKDSGIEWIGEVPEEWGITKFKYFLDTNKGLTITKENLIEDGIPVINYGQIHSKYGKSVSTDRDELPQVSANYLKFKQSLLKPGDFVFADTSEDIDGSGNFSTRIDDNGELFAGYHTIKAKLKNALEHDFRYFMHYFDSLAFRKQVQNKVSGIKVYSITQSILQETCLILPSLYEQTQIADFLDKKVAQLDSVKSLLEEQIKTLEDYRQSLIYETVTKGLDKTVPLKDSGVDWIGQIPEGWGRKRLKYLVNISTGTSNTQDKALDEEGYPFFVRSQTVEKLPTYTHDEEVILTAGDGAGVGKVFHYYKGKFTAHQRVYLLTRFEQIDAKYLFYYFSSNLKNEVLLGGAKSTVDSIRLPMLTNFVVTLPNTDEQTQIADFLDKKIEQINQMIAIKKEQIENINKQRQTLIYDYVTGKRRV
ncbi:restriction endonuclease subunit S [Streptococcus suis]|nr:restriction endonuclease subunit S [Streptococcus suis]